MINLLFILFMFLPLSLSAHSDINIGKKHTLFSSILQEERPYWVYLPPNYDNPEYGKTSYPVIYLLDGDTNFFGLVGIQKSFTRGMYNNMPESIIIAILNTDRVRDLTPTHSREKHHGKDMFITSGGSENFTKFLTGELREKVDSTYRTNGFNILIGHSFGGLFTVNTLIDHTSSFNAYIAIDPSLWWDNRNIYNKGKEIFPMKDFESRSLYIAMAKNEDKTGDKQKHSGTIEEFCTQVLPSAKDSTFNHFWKYYEQEDHGTILIPAMFDGLRKLFNGIELPVKEIPKKPDIVKEQYTKLSKRLGHDFIPEESLLNNIANYAVSVGEIDNAIKLYEYCVELYPDSQKAKARLIEVKEKYNK